MGSEMCIRDSDRPFSLRAADSKDWSAWSRSIVHGPQQRHYLVGPKPRGTVVGVSLRPGCMEAVLGHAAPELVNRHVCLEILWGRRGEELRQRLIVAGTPNTAFRVLETYLAGRCQGPPLMHPAVASALASRAHSPRVATLQRASGYSPRRFIAMFSESVGITPKRYYRIQRFNAIARCIASGTADSFAELAAVAGYADQAHLTRDFREFSGVPPTRYQGHAASPLHHRMTGADRAAPIG